MWNLQIKEVDRDIFLAEGTAFEQFTLAHLLRRNASVGAEALFGITADIVDYIEDINYGLYAANSFHDIYDEQILVGIEQLRQLITIGRSNMLTTADRQALLGEVMLEIMQLQMAADLDPKDFLLDEEE